MGSFGVVSILCNNVFVKLACCYCGTVDAQDEPRITMEIWPEIKRVGMTGYLNCTVTRQSNNKVC